MTSITQNNLDTIKACRYCPMCRQSCPSEFINYRESDTPRGRAILLQSIYKGGKEFDPSAIQAIYNCFLCGACKSWCAGQELGGYDIPELIKFARRDIVNKGMAPKEVDAVRNSLVENDNSRNRDRNLAYTASVTERQQMCFTSLEKESIIPILKLQKPLSIFWNTNKSNTPC